MDARLLSQLPSDLTYSLLTLGSLEEEDRDEDKSVP